MTLKNKTTSSLTRFNSDTHFFIPKLISQEGKVALNEGHQLLLIVLPLLQCDHLLHTQTYISKEIDAECK